MKRTLAPAVLFAALLAFTASAQQTSSIDPNVPGPGDDVDSYTVRQLALAAYNDITELFQQVNLPSIAANAMLGSLTGGVPVGIVFPNCTGVNKALTWTPGVGPGCNTISGGGGGSGTVASVTFTGDGVIDSATPSLAVTTTGTVTATPIAQAANKILAGPASGSAAVPSFRSLVGLDLPLPSSSSLGGVLSLAPVSNQFVTGVSTLGAPTTARPSFGDVSGQISASQYLAATATTIGAVKPDNSSTTIAADGTISAVVGGGGPTTNPVSLAQGGTASTSAPAALNTLFANTSTGQQAQVEYRLYNGAATSYVAQNTYCFNCDPAYLKKWRTSLGKVRSGQANARILLLGDSTTFGTGSNNTNTGNVKAQSYPTQMSGFINSLGVNAHWNSFLSDGSSAFETNHANDARITRGTGWTQASGTNGQSVGGQMFENSSSTANSLAFLPTVNVDTFVVWYKTFSGGGTLSLDINGSGTITQSTNSASGIGSVTITGSLGSDTLNIKWSSGGTIDICGVEAYDSSKKWIDLMNAGWAGSNSIDVSNSTNAWGPLNGLNAFSADLVIVDVGINDWNAAGSASAYKTNIQTLITQVVANGSSIILVTPAPTNPANGATIAAQTPFIDAMYALAVTNNLPLIDNYTRFGPAASNGTMYWTGNGVHPNMIGYADFATPITDFVLKNYIR